MGEDGIALGLTLKNAKIKRKGLDESHRPSVECGGHGWEGACGCWECLLGKLATHLRFEPFKGVPGWLRQKTM